MDYPCEVKPLLLTIIVLYDIQRLQFLDKVACHEGASQFDSVIFIRSVNIFTLSAMQWKVFENNALLYEVLKVKFAFKCINDNLLMLTTAEWIEHLFSNNLIRQIAVVILHACLYTHALTHLIYKKIIKENDNSQIFTFPWLCPFKIVRRLNISVYLKEGMSLILRTKSLGTKWL